MFELRTNVWTLNMYLRTQLTMPELRCLITVRGLRDLQFLLLLFVCWTVPRYDSKNDSVKTKIKRPLSLKSSDRNQKAGMGLERAAGRFRAAKKFQISSCFKAAMKHLELCSGEGGTKFLSATIRISNPRESYSVEYSVVINVDRWVSNTVNYQSTQIGNHRPVTGFE